MCAADITEANIEKRRKIIRLYSMMVCSVVLLVAWVSRVTTTVLQGTGAHVTLGRWSSSHPISTSSDVRSRLECSVRCVTSRGTCPAANLVRHDDVMTCGMLQEELSDVMAADLDVNSDADFLYSKCTLYVLFVLYTTIAFSVVCTSLFW